MNTKIKHQNTNYFEIWPVKKTLDYYIHQLCQMKVKLRRGIQPERQDLLLIGRTIGDGNGQQNKIFVSLYYKGMSNWMSVGKNDLKHFETERIPEQPSTRYPQVAM